MKPAERKDSDDDDQQCSFTATELDVYRNERLAYTELQKPGDPAPVFSQRVAAFLKAMYHWIHSR